MMGLLDPDPRIGPGVEPAIARLASGIGDASPAVSSPDTVAVSLGRAAAGGGGGSAADEGEASEEAEAAEAAEVEAETEGEGVAAAAGAAVAADVQPGRREGVVAPRRARRAVAVPGR